MAHLFNEHLTHGWGRWWFLFLTLNRCLTAGEEGYFTGMMLKRSRVKFLESEIVAYPTTQMMRNLLVAQVLHNNFQTLSHSHSREQEIWTEYESKSFFVLFRLNSKARNCVWWRLTWRVARPMPRSGWNSCEWWCRGWKRHRTTSPFCSEETQTWEIQRQVVRVHQKS